MKMTEIGLEGGIAIAEALEMNSTLEVLKVNYAGLFQESTERLLAAAEGHPSLKCLSIAMNSNFHRVFIHTAIRCFSCVIEYQNQTHLQGFLVRRERIMNQLVPLALLLEVKRIPLEIADDILALAWGDFDSTMIQTREDVENEEELRWGMVQETFTRARRTLMGEKAKIKWKLTE